MTLITHWSGLLGTVLCFSFCLSRANGDWPQWRGPNRDAKSNETGLLDAWPREGPRLVWRANGAGAGYSTVAISDGRVFTMGNREGAEVVVAFSLTDGAKLWELPTGGKPFENDRGNGPRGTPTITEGIVYSLGATGMLSAMKVADGAPIWNLNIVEHFDGEAPRWGMAESVLVEDDIVIATPGGTDCIVAVNKETGETHWKSKDLYDRPAYASAMIATIAGTRQIVHITASTALGLRVEDGELLWTYRRAVNNVANCTTPIVDGDYVFLSSGYGAGCALIKVSEDGGALREKEVYYNKNLINQHGGVLLHQDHVFGHSSGSVERTNAFVCLDILTGEIAWKEHSLGQCSVTYADGHLYCLTEDGVMVLVEANPEKYVEKGRFVFKTFDNFTRDDLSEEDEKPTWAHPVICDRKLYLRDQDALYCYELAEDR